MVYYYNLSAFDYTNNYYTYVQTANALVSDAFAAMLLFVVFIIVFGLITSRRGVFDAFPVSGFITTLFAISFWALSLISLSLVVAPFTILVIGVFLRVFFWDY